MWRLEASCRVSQWVICLTQCHGWNTAFMDIAPVSSGLPQPGWLHYHYEPPEWEPPRGPTSQESLTSSYWASCPILRLLSHYLFTHLHYSFNPHLNFALYHAEAKSTEAEPSAGNKGQVTVSAVKPEEQTLKPKEEPHSTLKFNFTIESIKLELFNGDSGLVRSFNPLLLFLIIALPLNLFLLSP